MCDEFCQQDLESLPLPKDWTANVRHAVLNVIGIVRIAMLAGREFLIQEDKPHVAQVHRLETEVAMLREELRINGARTRRIDPHQRPQYLPTERMAILELRAMRGWSKAETARRFFVSDDTIRAWLRRADDDSLIQTRTPVNRFPDFVRYVVQRIKLFCPTLGKVKIADKLARAGIHIGKTTVGRILKEKPAKEPEPSDETGTAKSHRREIRGPHNARRSDDRADQRRLLDQLGPNSLSQNWPVCWWLLNVVDHYSRRSMGFAVFKSEPSSEEVTAALDRIWLDRRHPSQTLDCRPGPHVQVRALRGGVVRREEHPATVRCRQQAR